MELLGDRLELGASPDDRASRSAQLDREGALGPDERVERTAVGRSDGCARLSSCDLAQHAADYGAAWAKVTPLQGHLSAEIAPICCRVTCTVRQ